MQNCFSLAAFQTLQSSQYIHTYLIQFRNSKQARSITSPAVIIAKTYRRQKCVKVNTYSTCIPHFHQQIQTTGTSNVLHHITHKPMIFIAARILIIKICVCVLSTVYSILSLDLECLIVWQCCEEPYYCPAHHIQTKTLLIQFWLLLFVWLFSR